MQKDFNINEIISKPNIFINRFKQRIINKYEKFWTISNSKNQSKLSFYFKFKKYFRFESYLDNLNKEYREAVCRFRLSSHVLPIEILRYQKIKIEERLCPICDTNEIGDEFHYFIKCNNQSMEMLRVKFNEEVCKIQPQLRYFDLKNKVKYCMNLSDTYLQNITAKFVKGILNTFQDEESKIKNMSSQSCNIM